MWRPLCLANLFYKMGLVLAPSVNWGVCSMEKTPMELLTIALELMLTIFVIGFIARFVVIGNNLLDSYQREIDSAIVMEEYAIYNKFDATQLSGADVVEAVFLHANNSFEIYVNSSSPTFGGSSFDASAITLENILATGGIVMTNDYNSKLKMHTNGHVIGIIFEGV